MSYSFRRLLTGLATAALMVWKLTVTTAMNNTSTVADRNIQAFMWIRQG